jgi:hypothetical protein
MHGLFWYVVLLLSIAAAPSAMSQTAQRHSPAQAATAQDDAEHQHPAWFAEPGRYKPCPASVEFPDSRHACLG